MRFQILCLMILIGVGSKVWPKSAWSSSYEKNKSKIAKIWTTPVDAILLVHYKGSTRDQSGIKTAESTRMDRSWLTVYWLGLQSL